MRDSELEESVPLIFRRAAFDLADLIVLPFIIWPFYQRLSTTAINKLTELDFGHSSGLLTQVSHGVYSSIKLLITC